MKKKILFVCIHNSARSQMAEALLNLHCGNEFEAQSAGLEPGTLNPLVVEVMREIGIELAGKQTRSVFDVIRTGQLFSHVITVCDETSAERCPVFPGVARRLHWSFPDPSKFEGTPEQRLGQTREVRDRIAARVKAWCATACGRGAAVTGLDA